MGFSKKGTSRVAQCWWVSQTLRSERRNLCGGLAEVRRGAGWLPCETGGGFAPLLVWREGFRAGARFFRSPGDVCRVGHRVGTARKLYVDGRAETGGLCGWRRYGRKGPVAVGHSGGIQGAWSGDGQEAGRPHEAARAGGPLPGDLETPESWQGDACRTAKAPHGQVIPLASFRACDDAWWERRRVRGSCPASHSPPCS